MAYDLTIEKVSVFVSVGSRYYWFLVGNSDTYYGCWCEIVRDWKKYVMLTQFVCMSVMHTFQFFTYFLSLGLIISKSRPYVTSYVKN